MSPTVPLWVFGLLAGLIALGIRQSRTRVVKPAVVAGIAAALLGLSRYGVASGFGATPLPLAAWALGVGTALALAGRVVAPRGLARVGQAVRVPGSWWPLVLMLGIFAGKTVLGVAHGMHAAAEHQTWFIVSASLLFGLLSGAFASRALAVWRFASRTPAA